MDIENKLDPSIDYSARQLTNSSLSHMRLVPLSGNQSATVSSGSGQDITFEIPVQAVNLGESYFYADVSIAGTASNYTWKHEGICPWSSVQLFTRGGQYLVNLQERATDYSRVVMTSDATDEDLQHGSSDGGSSLYANEEEKNLIGGKGADGSTAKRYWEQKYLKRSAIGGALTYRIIFPLKMLKGTIFEINKSLLFREVLVLKLKLAPGNDIAYVNTSDVNPDATPAAAGDITYSNITLYCAQERNAAVVEGLAAQTSSEAGMTVFSPFPSVFTNIRSGTSQNITLRLNKTHGSSLKSIKNCPFVDGSNNLRYDRINDTTADTANNKITSYYSNLNNNRLTEFDIVCGNDEDWMLHKKRFKDSPIYNNDIYKQNWIHEDGFENEANKVDGEVDTNCYGGIDLSQEVRYDFYATCRNASLRHFSIVHGQKVLNINNRGIAYA
jgi:hypothetical protein